MAGDPSGRTLSYEVEVQASLGGNFAGGARDAAQLQDCALAEGKSQFCNQAICFVRRVFGYRYDC